MPTSVNTYSIMQAAFMLTHRTETQLYRVAKNPAAFTTSLTFLPPPTALLLKHTSLTKIKGTFIQLGSNP